MESKARKQSTSVELGFGVFRMNSSSRDFTLRVPTNYLNDYASAFQTALHLFEVAELTEFLPSPDHPRYLEILCELVRIELVHGWKIDKPTSLDTYLQRYPQINEKPAFLYRIANEEFSLRRKAGQNPTLAEYRNRLDADLDDWPTTIV